MPSQSEPSPATERRRIAVDGDRVGGVGLELDRVGAGGVGAVDELDRGLEALPVVGRDLGDDVDRAGRDRSGGR